LNFIFFVAASAVARIFLEAFRGDSMIWPGGFRAAQVIGLGVLVISIFFMRKWGAIELSVKQEEMQEA
jgi:prolipoprotein diacylglyceryltransferase